MLREDTYSDIIAVKKEDQLERSERGARINVHGMNTVSLGC